MSNKDAVGAARALVDKVFAELEGGAPARAFDRAKQQLSLGHALDRFVVARVPLLDQHVVQVAMGLHKQPVVLLTDARENRKVVLGLPGGPFHKETAIGWPQTFVKDLFFPEGSRDPAWISQDTEIEGWWHLHWGQVVEWSPLTVDPTLHTFRTFEHDGVKHLVHVHRENGWVCLHHETRGPCPKDSSRNRILELQVSEGEDIHIHAAWVDGTGKLKCIYEVNGPDGWQVCLDGHPSLPIQKPVFFAWFTDDKLFVAHQLHWNMAEVHEIDAQGRMMNHGPHFRNALVSRGGRKFVSVDTTGSEQDLSITLPNLRWMHGSLIPRGSDVNAVATIGQDVFIPCTVQGDDDRLVGFRVSSEGNTPRGLYSAPKGYKIEDIQVFEDCVGLLLSDGSRFCVQFLRAVGPGDLHRGGLLPITSSLYERLVCCRGNRTATTWRVRDGFLELLEYPMI